VHRVLRQVVSQRCTGAEPGQLLLRGAFERSLESGAVDVYPDTPAFLIVHLLNCTATRGRPLAGGAEPMKYAPRLLKAACRSGSNTCAGVRGAMPPRLGIRRAQQIWPGHRPTDFAAQPVAREFPPSPAPTAGNAA
jgi:hypothetical protein